jgi:hypothetical protein
MQGVNSGSWKGEPEQCVRLRLLVSKDRRPKKHLVKVDSGRDTVTKKPVKGA